MTGEPGEALERRSVSIAGRSEGREWGIAVESPVEIRVNGAAWTMMLATPTELEDLAVGLALTEQLVRDPAAISAIRLSSWLGEYTVDLEIPSPLPNRRGRALAGVSGCGLCGLESLAAFRAGLDDSWARPVADGAGEISDEAIRSAWAALPERQPINRETHSVHAAAWCSPDGRIEQVREDVGRHNALDKLVGARARGGHHGSAGFIVMTSRCSYELVAKAAVGRALLLATISAPTTLALAWSETLGLSLASAGPGRQVVRFPKEAAHAAG